MYKDFININNNNFIVVIYNKIASRKIRKL